MADILLYTLVVPKDSQSDLLNRLQQQLATAGILDQDGSVVEQLSSEPGNQTVSGLYRDPFAAKMATELEELARASGFDELPLTGLDGATSQDGYYVLESADVDQVQPHTTLVQQFDLSLTKKGTQNGFWRALETNPRQVNHDFGGDLDVLVGIPAAATKVRWYDPATGATEPASTLETRSAELGDVDIYDVDASPLSTDTPALIYEIDYGAEETVDCRVWDTQGTSDKLDADGNLQWQKVFATDHDVTSDAELILDSGLLRVRFDEAAGTIAAQEWDETNTTWTDVGLSRPSGVSLLDVDLTTIGMATIQAQLLIDDNGTLYSLDVILARGDTDALFAIPENEGGPIPTNIQDWLSPIAKTTLVDPQTTKTVVDRHTVRK